MGDKEKPDAYSERTWKFQMHTENDGLDDNGDAYQGKNVMIPGHALKKCIAEGAKYLSIKIEGGGGQAKYSKNFLAGIMIVESFPIGIKTADVKVPERHFMSPNGKGGRVWRLFPTFKEWSANVEVLILDDAIPNDVFDWVIKQSGLLIGLGRWRAINGGNYGRFEVENLTIEEM